MFYGSSLEKGLSFIQVMIVLVVITVFGLAVCPKMINYFKIKTTEVSVPNIKQAIFAYYRDIGLYPEALDDLIYKPLDDNIASKWQGPYIDTENDDWDYDLVYYRPEPDSGKIYKYKLYRYGPNSLQLLHCQW